MVLLERLQLRLIKFVNVAGLIGIDEHEVQLGSVLLQLFFTFVERRVLPIAHRWYLVAAYLINLLSFALVLL
jgi:hypothetical protein